MIRNSMYKPAIGYQYNYQTIGYKKAIKLMFKQRYKFFSLVKAKNSSNYKISHQGIVNEKKRYQVSNLKITIIKTKRKKKKRAKESVVKMYREN